MLTRKGKRLFRNLQNRPAFTDETYCEVNKRLFAARLAFRYFRTLLKIQLFLNVLRSLILLHV